MCWPSFRLDLDASGGAAFLLNLCLFIGYAGSLLLYGPFSSCGRWGLLFVVVREPLIITVTSLVAEYRL